MTTTFGGVLAADGLQTRLDAPLLWTLFGGATLLFVGVMALLARAVLATARPVRTGWWLVGGGLVLPCCVLGLLAVASLRELAARAAAPPGALVVGVSARTWWWQLRVPGPQDGPEIVLANELVLPVGRPVRLALASESLIHSLWVPELGGKMDLVPGRITHLVLQAERPGRWRGPCAEFCGSGHTQMVLNVVALAAADYDAWLAAQAAPARAPASARQQRGQQLFQQLHCGQCHTLRGVVQARLGRAGTEDGGGPDLTHLASRAWLGAGTLANDAAGLRRWLRDAPRLKPGTRMPSYDHLDDETLDALVDYLGQLQ